jgi:hypothetical protein
MKTKHNSSRAGGFLSWKETGSRLTKNTPAGLRSVDLGPITMAEAQKAAWIHGVVLLVSGRIRGRYA